MYMVPLCSSGSIVFSRFHCVLQVSLCSLGFIVFSWFHCILSVPLCYTGSIVFSWFHCILLVPLYSPVYCFLMEKLQSQENDSIFHIFYQIKDIQNRALPIAMLACRGSFKVTTYLVPSRKDSSRQIGCQVQQMATEKSTNCAQRHMCQMKKERRHVL